jgi:hypothetical protein
MIFGSDVTGRLPDSVKFLAQNRHAAPPWPALFPVLYKKPSEIILAGKSQRCQ